MAKKAFPWLSILVMIVLLVAAVPAPITQAGTVPPIEVNGLFYGDGDFARYQVYGYSPPIPPSTRTRATLYKADAYDADGDRWVYFAVVLDRSVNDNVFANRSTGTPDRGYLDSSGWGTKGHTFDQLYSSDMVEFQVTCGEDVWDWQHGYLYDADGDHDPTEADWLSGPADPNGGAGAWPTTAVGATSLQWNMNNYALNPSSGWDVTLGGSRAYAVWKSPASGSAAGEVSHIVVTNQGTNYTSAPTVTITGGGGSGATAVAEYNPVSLKVDFVHLTNRGSGYTSAPTVTFAGGGGSGAAATAVLGPNDAANDWRVTDEIGYPPPGEQPDDEITFDSSNQWEWPLVYEFAFNYTDECQPDTIATLIVSAHNSPVKDTSEDVPLSVDLLWFRAKSRLLWPDTVLLGWRTASETSNLGFYLWRATTADLNAATRINEEIIPSKVPFGGGGAVYRYVDRNLLRGTTYYYWLQDLDDHFVEGWSDPIEVTTR